MRGCRLNRDPSFFFQLHTVHGGTNAVLTTNFVDGMNAIGVEQDTFGQGGLARVDMGADSNVPDFR